jgi:hypothetical protein
VAENDDEVMEMIIGVGTPDFRGCVRCQRLVFPESDNHKMVRGCEREVIEPRIHRARMTAIILWSWFQRSVSQVFLPIFLDRSELLQRQLAVATVSQ